MTRLIDADAIERYLQNDWKNNEISNGRWIYLKEVLNTQPTIDAVPVRHGKWNVTEENHGFDDEVRNKAIACSVCKVAFKVDEYQTEDFRYCPNCGARMDEE